MNFLTYVTWDNVLKWKEDEIFAGRHSKKDHRKPYAFGTSKRYIYNQYKKSIKDNSTDKSVLWIFSIPRFERLFSRPSLIVKLTIDIVIDRDNEEEKVYEDRIPKYIKDRWIKDNKNLGWRYVVIGKRKLSRYYPYNYIYKELKAAVKQDSRKSVPKENEKRINSYFSNYFRTIKRIDKNANKKLAKFDSKIKIAEEKHNIIFISYRRGDGTDVVFKTIEMLTRAKLFCWMDTNRIPQVEEENINFLKFFYYELLESIEKSSIFLALKREDYFESKWTTLEYCLAEHENKRRKKIDKKCKELKMLEYDIKMLRKESAVKNLVRKVRKSLNNVQHNKTNATNS
jgi:hypothetical protein